ncbi:MAG: alpha/beta fold hydrolase [Bacteriovoracaceae bacterium]
MDESTEKSNTLVQEEFHYLDSQTGKEKLLIKTFSREDVASFGKIFIFHDYFDYHKYYVEFAHFLASRGLKVVIHDHKGLGRSSGSRGYVNSWDDYLNDCRQVIQEFQETKEDFFILGTGLGAVLGIDLCLNSKPEFLKRIRGLICLNPALKLKIHYPDWGRGMLHRFPKFLEKVHFPVQFNYHRFCTEYHHAQLVNADPLVPHDISLKTLSELLNAGFNLRKKSYFLDKPSLVLLSEKGHICDNDFIKVFMKGFQKNLLQLKEIKDSYHDLLHDQRKDEVYKEIEKWLKNFKTS